MTATPFELPPVLAAVLVASVLGSAHCAGMCGVFVALAIDPRALIGGQTKDEPRRRTAPRRLAALSAYSAGRLAGYAALGALAGALGAGLDLGGSAVGLQRAASMLAGITMLLVAMAMLLRVLGLGALLPQLRSSGTGRSQRPLAQLHRAAFSLPEIPRATAIGLLAILLPCGWLYAFVLIAAGSGSPVVGALVMVAFWLGTLPALGAVALGVHLVGASGRRWLALPAALLLLGTGLWTLGGRAAMPALRGAEAIRAVGTEATIDRVRAAAAEIPPCCRSGDDSVAPESQP